MVRRFFKLARKKNTAIEQSSDNKSRKMSLEERRKNLNQLIQSINTQRNEVSCGFISDENIKSQIDVQFIPTPNDDLNKAVGGGFPRGRLSIVSGLSDSGKTSLVLESIGLMMKKDPDFIALWLETEQSLSFEYAVSQFKIDPERFVFIRSTDEGGEEALDKCIAILKSKMVDIFCINSLRALVPKSELNKSITEDTVAMQARMNTKALKQIMQASYSGNIATIVIQHLTTMIGTMSRDPYALGGGLLLKYGGLLILDMRKQSILDSDPISRDEGMKVMISVKKNHIVPRVNPYVKVPHFIVYGEGTETILSTLNRAIEQGILRKSGAWIYWDDKQLSWQGKEKFRMKCKEDPDFLQELKNLTNNNIQSLSEEEIKELGISPEGDKKELELVEIALNDEDNNESEVED